MISSRGDQLPSLPAYVTANVASRWPSAGPTWSARVEQELADLADRLDATSAVRMDSRVSFVVAFESPQGSVVVRSTPDPAGWAQARAMQALAVLEVGPRVIERWESAIGTWVMTEQVIPGSRALGAADDELAYILTRMVGQSEAVDELPRVSAWLHDRLAQGCESDLAPGASPPTWAEREHGLAALSDLLGDESTSVTHGDMSFGNILRAGAAGLSLIDPRGVAGDVEYDIAVLSFKTGRDTRRLARMIGADPDRADAWRTVAVAARV